MNAKENTTYRYSWRVMDPQDPKWNPIIEPAYKEYCKETK